MHLSIASETLYFQKCSPQHETDLRQYYEQGYFFVEYSNKEMERILSIRVLCYQNKFTQ